MDLTFERPRLVNETEPKPAESPVLDEPSEEAVNEVASEPDDDDESWRDEIVAEIFDSPPSRKTPQVEIRDPYTMWVEAQKAFELEARSKKRRASHFPKRGAGAHVCAEVPSTDAGAVSFEDAGLSASGVPPDG